MSKLKISYPNIDNEGFIVSVKTQKRVHEDDFKKAFILESDPTFIKYNTQRTDVYIPPVDLYPMNRPLVVPDIEEAYATDSNKKVIFGTFKFISKFSGLLPDKNVPTNKMFIKYTRMGSDGPIILYIHGVPGNRKLKLDLQTLTAPFCRTVSIDLLGMGESAAPRYYGQEDLLQKASSLLGKNFEPDQSNLIYDAWEWEHDATYIKKFMDTLYPNEKFFLEGDDWGGGVAAAYTSKYHDSLISTIYTNPIAFDGYPVKEIEAIGRASSLRDKDFRKSMGDFDQKLTQIFKTMVQNSGFNNEPTRFDQYTLREITAPYAKVDYEKGKPPSEMTLDFHRMRILSDRASILNPELLMPYTSKSGKGVKYNEILIPQLVMWGENDNMMPAAQTNRFANAFINAQTFIHYIPRAGHFSQIDQPMFCAETILNHIRNMSKVSDSESLSQYFMGYFIPRWKGDEPEFLERMREFGL